MDDAALLSPLQITPEADVPPDLWPIWRYAVIGDGRLYYPQLGDEVVVSWPAYKIECNTESIPRGSNEIVSALVTSIKYGETDLKLRILPQGSDTTLSIDYRYPPGQHFLLEQRIFETCLVNARELQPGDTIVTLAFSTDGQPHATQLKVFENRKGFLHNAIVGETEGGERCECSAWDLFAVNGVLLERAREKEEIKQYLPDCRKLIGGLIEDAQFQPFVSVPRTAEYRDKVSFPMSLLLMIERIETRYYRSLDSIRGDADLLLTNTKELYGDTAPEASTAKHLKERITHNLRLMTKKRKR
jgi:hypothetical protein